MVDDGTGGRYSTLIVLKSALSGNAVKPWRPVEKQF